VDRGTSSVGGENKTLTMRGVGLHDKDSSLVNTSDVPAGLEGNSRSGDGLLNGINPNIELLAFDKAVALMGDSLEEAIFFPGVFLFDGLQAFKGLFIAGWSTSFAGLVCLAGVPFLAGLLPVVGLNSLGGTIRLTGLLTLVGVPLRAGLLPISRLRVFEGLDDFEGLVLTALRRRAYFPGILISSTLEPISPPTYVSHSHSPHPTSHPHMAYGSLFPADRHLCVISLLLVVMVFVRRPV
jgi:hypothetical protein